MTRWLDRLNTIRPGEVIRIGDSEGSLTKQGLASDPTEAGTLSPQRARLAGTPAGESPNPNCTILERVQRDPMDITRFFCTPPGKAGLTASY
jgi:hypothetical protein